VDSLPPRLKSIQPSSPGDHRVHSETHRFVSRIADSGGVLLTSFSLIQRVPLLALSHYRNPCDQCYNAETGLSQTASLRATAILFLHMHESHGPAKAESDLPGTPWESPH
jgi:hypothetical protein